MEKDIALEFEHQADELRSLMLKDDITQVNQDFELFIENADRRTYVGVCYSVGLSINSYVEMSKDMEFIEFNITGNAETSIPMAFYLNTFLNSLIWQNPKLAVAAADSIARHSKRTRAHFLWKLLVTCHSLSEMLVADLQGETK